MIHEIVRCYADVLYLKTMLRLPPPSQQHPDTLNVNRAGGPAPRHGRKLGRSIPGHLAHAVLAALQRHFERIGTSAPSSSRRTFRRIGG